MWESDYLLRPRQPTSRSKKKDKIDDFRTGDRVDVKYSKDLPKYERDNDRWISSKNFGDTIVADIPFNMVST